MEDCVFVEQRSLWTNVQNTAVIAKTGSLRKLWPGAKGKGHGQRDATLCSFHSFPSPLPFFATSEMTAAPIPLLLFFVYKR
jgi:hypothetical protein